MSHLSVVIAGRYAAGLTWRPLVADGAVAQVALARARDEKAGMYVHDGATAVVGLGTFPKKGTPKTLFALASMAAKAFPNGESIFVIAVGADLWWVGAATNGTPQLDQVVSSAQDAWAAAEKAQETKKSAGLHGDPQLFPQCQPLSIEQLRTLESPQVQLRDARKKLPAWSYLAALGLCGMLAYQRGIPLATRYFAKQQVVVHPAVDPVAAWTAANAAWLQRVKAPTGADLEPLRDAIYQLPLHVGGWDLTGVTCSASAVWQCAASYRRPSGIESESTNRTFEDSRPKAWKVAWKGATDLTAAFDVQNSTATALNADKHVLPLQVYQVDTYSEFQQLAKVFEKVDVLDMTRAEVAAPVDRNGTALNRPGADHVPELFRAKVTFTGPLRNLEIAESMKAPVFWSEVAVQRTKTDKPSLHSSEFVAVMKGEIHAKTK